MKEGYDKYKNVEITENTIFAKILKLVIRGFRGKKSNNQVQYRYNLEHNYEQNNDLNVIKVSYKINLFNKIFENIENKFKIIEELDIIKLGLGIGNWAQSPLNK